MFRHRYITTLPALRRLFARHPHGSSVQAADWLFYAGHYFSRALFDQLRQQWANRIERRCHH